jgi:hypothetical protein
MFSINMRDNKRPFVSLTFQRWCIDTKIQQKNMLFHWSGTQTFSESFTASHVVPSCFAYTILPDYHYPNKAVAYRYWIRIMGIAITTIIKHRLFSYQESRLVGDNGGISGRLCWFTKLVGSDRWWACLKRFSCVTPDLSAVYLGYWFTAASALGDLVEKVQSWYGVTCVSQNVTYHWLKQMVWKKAMLHQQECHCLNLTKRLFPLPRSYQHI